MLHLQQKLKRIRAHQKPMISFSLVWRCTLHISHKSIHCVLCVLCCCSFSHRLVEVLLLTVNAFTAVDMMKFCVRLLSRFCFVPIKYLLFECANMIDVWCIMYPHLLLPWKHFLGSFRVLCHNTCCMQMSLNRAVGFLQFHENLRIRHFSQSSRISPEYCSYPSCKFLSDQTFKTTSIKNCKTLLYEIYMFKETNYS